MATSRRVFLKSSAIAGATAALGVFPAAAEPLPAPEPSPAPPHSDPTELFTRGPGIYPGDPREEFSPTMAPAPPTYRNLALHRPAFHSSSYDYNLTAQLVTDGIIDTHPPYWIATTVSGRGLIPKTDREFLLDHSDRSGMRLGGPHPTVQFELGGGTGLPEVDRLDLFLVVPAGTVLAGLRFTVSVSDDGRHWEEVGTASSPQAIPTAGYPPDLVRGGQLLHPSLPLTRTCRNRFFQVAFSDPSLPENSTAQQWNVTEVVFFHAGKRVEIGGPYSFTSAWMSAGPGEEWVYIDLGPGCQFDRVKLFWIARAADGAIQVGDNPDDPASWRDLHTWKDATALVDDIRLPRPARGRYLRVLMKRPVSADGYTLSEVEVYGRGGTVPRPKPALAAAPDGHLNLAGGAWRVERSSQVSASGPALAQPGYADSTWIAATVPGTVLASFLNVEAIPDPDYGRNQLFVSDSFFYADFWYRTEFVAPKLPPGRMAWLSFESVNWKAEVFLNGESLGRIDGAFTSGRFDVTTKLCHGTPNALAVRIEKNATPGSCKQKTYENGGPNGGALSTDGPTYAASVGWDWIPTIRGRNTGLIGGVSLSTTGPVTLHAPFVTTALPLPDTSHADITLTVDLTNHHPAPVSGTLRGRFGDARFEQPVTLPASATQRVTLDPATHPALRVKDPQLWWPVGYGEPHLYDLELAFEPAGAPVSHTLTSKAGIRQMRYSEEDGVLRMWINGRRFIPRGGNWGFSESMLRYRDREYDAALSYHREMNFNMVRNWVGQVNDDAFYEACDRYGVMVWQDFWLPNPWDGPPPADEALFLGNARDTLLRIRNHACIGIYCGRNEGSPPPTVDAALRKLIAELHPGQHYISSSSEGVVGGGGPYRVMPTEWYFSRAAYPKLHSEIGIPNPPSIESVRAMMPGKALWPRGLEWGLHDFPEGGPHFGPNFLDTVEATFGATDTLEEWLPLAHFIDYEGFRAEFEAQSQHRMGLLLWMSHPCWPSLLWQTYDYYLEPTCAFFASKHACEPLHIQWNRATDAIEVVNYSAGKVEGLTALAEVLNMDGSVKWTRSAACDSEEDTVQSPFRAEFPAALTPVHFLRLTLSRAGAPVSTNLYLRGLQEGNLRAIRQLPKARVQSSTTSERAGPEWRLTTHLRNLSPFPALMLRLQAVRERSGDRILPVLFSDNYITLMPGDEGVVTTVLKQADTRGERPRLVLGGFNVEPQTS